jgi:hypothetical protein
MEGSEQAWLPPAHDTRAWEILNSDEVLQKRWVQVAAVESTLIM